MLSGYFWVNFFGSKSGFFEQRVSSGAFSFGFWMLLLLLLLQLL
jgi:hypothetical protein